METFNESARDRLNANPRLTGFDPRAQASDPHIHRPNLISGNTQNNFRNQARRNFVHSSRYISRENPVRPRTISNRDIRYQTERWDNHNHNNHNSNNNISTAPKFIRDYKFSTTNPRATLIKPQTMSSREIGYRPNPVNFLEPQQDFPFAQTRSKHNEISNHAFSKVIKQKFENQRPELITLPRQLSYRDITANQHNTHFQPHTRIRPNHSNHKNTHSFYRNPPRPWSSRAIQRPSSQSLRFLPREINKPHEPNKQNNPLTAIHRVRSHRHLATAPFARIQADARDFNAFRSRGPPLNLDSRQHIHTRIDDDSDIANRLNADRALHTEPKYESNPKRTHSFRAIPKASILQDSRRQIFADQRLERDRRHSANLQPSTARFQSQRDIPHANTDLQWLSKHKFSSKPQFPSNRNITIPHNPELHARHARRQILSQRDLRFNNGPFQTKPKHEGSARRDTHQIHSQKIINQNGNEFQNLGPREIIRLRGRFDNPQIALNRVKSQTGVVKVADDKAHKGSSEYTHHKMRLSARQVCRESDRKLNDREAFVQIKSRHFKPYIR